MKVLHYLLLLLIPMPAAAIATGQEGEYHNYGQAYGYSNRHEAYAFADTANVRREARTDAPVQDRLRQGDIVHIIKVGEDFSVNGKTAPWCTVSYEMNGKKKTGALWAGLLCPRMLHKGDTRFLYGMKFPATDTGSTLVDIKALQGDRIKHVPSSACAARKRLVVRTMLRYYPIKGWQVCRPCFTSITQAKPARYRHTSNISAGIERDLPVFRNSSPPQMGAFTLLR
jgi:hypothetical protein